MTPTLAELAAQMEIREVLYRLCRAIDRGDRDGMLSAFHPDASDAHGPGGPAVVAEALVQKFDATPRMGQHHITNVLAHVSGEVASVESYFIIFNAQSSENGGEHDLVGGRYLDRFERRDQQWRIAQREIVVDVARSDLAGRNILDALPFPIGARRDDDRSAALFSPQPVADHAAPEKVESSQ
jgi:ketosteroid isomerase-like protein